MTYKISHVDTKNFKWMENNNSVKTLRQITLGKGKLRGLGKFDIEFEYPIAAIAGENGSGKSTLLAIAACAFHNQEGGFKLDDRKNPYYTFSDFFVQTQDELPPQGILLKYGILSDRWRGGKAGMGHQTRKKKKGGKWTNYDTRVKRVVVYSGIQRIVPYNERSTHKSYRSRFKKGTMDVTTRDQIRDIASKVIGKNYTDFDIHQHTKYSLPVVSCDGVTYSGFNMGADECAVFEILTSLFRAGNGVLLVIDEIELGLHEKAQRRLIEELKILCTKQKCQIICSTHSHAVLGALPPQGRFFVESNTDESNVLSGISADFACGKLKGENSGELDLFVEDDVARATIMSWLPYSLRTRINIMPIGSAVAVLRVLSTRYLENKLNCMAVLDGDQCAIHEKAKSQVANFAEASTEEEKNQVKDWVDERLTYLPGESWPEKWMIETASKGARDLKAEATDISLTKSWGLPNDAALLDVLDSAKISEKHNEFYDLGKKVELPEHQVRSDIIRFIKDINPDSLDVVAGKIIELLEAGT